MPEDQRMHDTDRLLDQVLADYAGEPRSGFESRVVRAVREKRNDARSWTRLWWPAAAAATIATVIAFTFGVRAGEQRSNARWQNMAAARLNTPPAAVVEPPKPAVIASATVPCKAVRSNQPARLRAVAHRNSRVFPTPAPLSAEEKALANFAARSDPQTVSSFLRASAIEPAEPGNGASHDRQ